VGILLSLCDREGCPGLRTTSGADFINRTSSKIRNFKVFSGWNSISFMVFAGLKLNKEGQGVDGSRQGPFFFFFYPFFFSFVLSMANTITIERIRSIPNIKPIAGEIP
jgi:hypothetical protein